ncbi:MAG: preprotein translocase subunit Sec61beta, partial [Nanoarchaeota archaeon]
LTGYIYILPNTYYTSMADDKIRMPSSGGGLIRYYDEYKSKYEFPPIYVVVAVAAVLVLVTILRYTKPLG